MDEPNPTREFRCGDGVEEGDRAQGDGISSTSSTETVGPCRTEGFPLSIIRVGSVPAICSICVEFHRDRFVRGGCRRFGEAYRVMMAAVWMVLAGNKNISLGFGEFPDIRPPASALGLRRTGQKSHKKAHQSINAFWSFISMQRSEC